jgi:hypothetical protein
MQKFRKLRETGGESIPQKGALKKRNVSATFSKTISRFLGVDALSSSVQGNLFAEMLNKIAGF